MRFLHEELRAAREQAGLSQQALGELAGIPRNQIVRAERGENITIDTLRKIAAHLPVTSLTLLDTKGLRIDAVAEPERLFQAAVENVLRQAGALSSAIQVAMHARLAVEAARREETSLIPEDQQTADIDPVLLLHHLGRIADDLQALGKDMKIA